METFEFHNRLQSISFWLRKGDKEEFWNLDGAKDEQTLHGIMGKFTIIA